MIAGPYAAAMAALKAAGQSEARTRLAAQHTLLSKTTMFSPKRLIDAGEDARLVPGRVLLGRFYVGCPILTADTSSF